MKFKLNEIKTSEELKNLTGIIYIVRNKINNKKYIGQSVNSFITRYGASFNHHNDHLNRSIEKHGIENFEVIISCDGIEDVELLNELEIELIKEYKTFKHGGKYGYNQTMGGDGVGSGEDCIFSRRCFLILPDGTKIDFGYVGEACNYILENKLAKCSKDTIRGAYSGANIIPNFESYKYGYFGIDGQMEIVDQVAALEANREAGRRRLATPEGREANREASFNNNRRNRSTEAGREYANNAAKATSKRNKVKNIEMLSNIDISDYLNIELNKEYKDKFVQYCNIPHYAGQARGLTKFQGLKKYLKQLGYSILDKQVGIKINGKWTTQGISIITKANETKKIA